MVEARAIKTRMSWKRCASSRPSATGATRPFPITSTGNAGASDHGLRYDFLYSIPGLKTWKTSSSLGSHSWPNWRHFSDRIIQPGDLVIIDMAAVTWNGYKSCMYRTYCVGKKPTQEQKDYYNIAYEWLYRAIDKVTPGATTKEIAGVLALSNGHVGLQGRGSGGGESLGHGLGLAQYDTPVISRIYSLEFPVVIQPGMSFALETQHGKPLQWGCGSRDDGGDGERPGSHDAVSDRRNYRHRLRGFGSRVSGLTKTAQAQMDLFQALRSRRLGELSFPRTRESRFILILAQSRKARQGEPGLVGKKFNEASTYETACAQARARNRHSRALCSRRVSSAHRSGGETPPVCVCALIQMTVDPDRQVPIGPSPQPTTI